MNSGFKHSSRWNFGAFLWHKSTKEKGMVTGIVLRAGSSASYLLVFEDCREEEECLEIELTEEPQVKEEPI